MDKNTLIIDSHVHTYASAEIGRQAVGPRGYGYAGTISELQEVMKNSRISYALMANLTPIQEMSKINIAKIPENLNAPQREKEIQAIHIKMIERLQRRNQWTCEAAKEHRNVLALVSVDPLQNPEGMAAEVENKVKNRGAKGVKLHPVVGEYYPGDPRMWPVYSKTRDLGVPILFHSGRSELPGCDLPYARPSQFESVAKAFPQMIIILGHFGRGYYEEAIVLGQKYPNIFFDTSACFQEAPSPSGRPEEQICRMIKIVGAHRVLFGSDWPWFDPMLDIQKIRNMDLKDEEKRLVLGLNAQKIYNL